MCKKVLYAADVLIPKNIDMKKWSVVACDQYTSEKEYWNQVAQQVGDECSSLHLTFPEIYLEDDGFESRIESIKDNMHNYILKNIFEDHKNAYIYVERKLANGKTRNGIVGMIDLECYDYSKGAQNLVRATEGTVIERIPPRVKIRQDCPLELPHVMLLIDDDNKSIIEPIAKNKNKLNKVYSFDLMKNSGSISGFLLDEECCNILDDGLKKISDKALFDEKYNVNDKGVLLFAVGDGNHSLATAKRCYENLKDKIGEQAKNHPARYALVEIVNLHDDSLEFEAIHRVMFNVDPMDVINKFNEYYKIKQGSTNGQSVEVVVSSETFSLEITNPTLNLTVGSLQEFIDYYIEKFGGKVDYIHGADVVKSLTQNDKNSIGFILDCMDKSDLFKTVILDGALPRKTFSMGEACDKRFYLEARKII